MAPDDALQIENQPQKELSLSNLGATLNALQSDSPESAAKLEGLTDAVAEGAYRVDAFAVVASILNDSLR